MNAPCAVLLIAASALSAQHESPARPGESVHLFVTGLGPVDCPTATGQPAPLDRLCRITTSVDWRWIVEEGVTVPADVSFVGLAPGLIGVYQLDVETPVPASSAGWALLTVGRDSRFFASVPSR